MLTDKIYMYIQEKFTKVKEYNTPTTKREVWRSEQEIAFADFVGGRLVAVILIKDPRYAKMILSLTEYLSGMQEMTNELLKEIY